MPSSILAIDHAAIDGRVLGNLPRRGGECPLQDLQPGPSHRLQSSFSSRPRHRCNAAAQAATRDDPLGHCRLGGADGIVERVLAAFISDFDRRPDADHRDAAGEFRQPLLQLLLVVVAGGLGDLGLQSGRCAPSMADRSPAPPTIVVSSLSTTTRLARPS